MRPLLACLGLLGMSAGAMAVTEGSTVGASELEIIECCEAVIDGGRTPFGWYVFRTHTVCCV